MLIIRLDPAGFARVLRRLAAWWAMGESYISPERIVTCCAVRLDGAL